MAGQSNYQVEDFFVKQVAKRYNANEAAVRNAITLLQDGNTVPFIVRYKSSMISGINDINIQQIRNDYDDLM